MQIKRWMGGLSASLVLATVCVTAGPSSAAVEPEQLPQPVDELAEPDPLDENPGLQATAVVQSDRDGGARQVFMSADRHCKTVWLDDADPRLIRERSERRLERAKRRRLELDGQGAGVSVDALPAVSHLEEVDTWGSSLVVQDVERRISEHVDASAELFGYEVEESGERIVVVHQADADLSVHRAALQDVLQSSEQMIDVELSDLAASDISDLTAEEQQMFFQDLAEQRRVIPASVDIQVEFRPVCRAGANDLDDVQRSIESFEWADNAISNDFRMAVERDLIHGRVVVTLKDRDTENRAARRLLRRRYRADVRVKVDASHALFAAELQVTARSSVRGAPLQSGRYADKSPHLGGVMVGDRGFRKGACTTGFAINVDGGRSMLTAGHCETVLPVRTWLFSGLFSDRTTYNSYGEFYKSWWRSGDVVDVGLIGSGSHTYRRKIYTDPDSGGYKERLVTAVWEPWVGARNVCFSGAFTGNRCGGKVTERFSACYRDDNPGRCGYQYTAVSQSGRRLTRPGDSGGPVYLQSGRTNARAFGIISTALDGEYTFIGPTAIYRTTGGWIASACCDASSKVRR